MASIEELNKSKAQLRARIQDYIRLRLGDAMVDVELDAEHYNMAIDQSILRYRQRAANATEESYAFLDLVGEVQSYTLPQEILEVRQVFRRGIGSVTGTTASQFEPFASGYLNTYMLVAGRVGGLVNYELFTQYQELAMRMFGGHVNFTWNRVGKQLTIVRKMPNLGGASGTASATAIVGDIITVSDTRKLTVNAPITFVNTTFGNVESGKQYYVKSIPTNGAPGTITISDTVGGTVIQLDDATGNMSWVSGNKDQISETVLLWCNNYKPEITLLQDYQIFPWVQEYAFAIAKHTLGEAREKFNTIASPQGGTSLNGATLKTEAKELMDKLEEELKLYVDGSQPYWFVIG
jgi:hypothetical protein